MASWLASGKSRRCVALFGGTKSRADLMCDANMAWSHAWRSPASCVRRRSASRRTGSTGSSTCFASSAASSVSARLRNSSRDAPAAAVAVAEAVASASSSLDDVGRLRAHDAMAGGELTAAASACWCGLGERLSHVLETAAAAAARASSGGGAEQRFTRSSMPRSAKLTAPFEIYAATRTLTSAFLSTYALHFYRFADKVDGYSILLYVENVQSNILCFVLHT